MSLDPIDSLQIMLEGKFNVICLLLGSIAVLSLVFLVIGLGIALNRILDRLTGP